MNINDPDVSLLASLSQSMMEDYLDSDDTRWANSPFDWIRSRPSRQRGTIGELLVSGFLASKGFDVIKSPDSDADRIVEASRVEIKLSTRWASGVYKFQQIRDQNYDILICLGVSPFSASMWAISKRELMHQRRRGAVGLSSQHGGAQATETAWLSFDADSPPRWLASHGGTLREGADALHALFKPR